MTIDYKIKSYKKKKYNTDMVALKHRLLIENP